MFNFLVVLVISLSLYECVALKQSPEFFCESGSGTNKTLRLTVHSEKNKDNEWFDKFTACTKYSNSSVTMDIDVKHTVFECDGERQVFIEGAANASRFSTAKDPLPFHTNPLRFHEIHGDYAEIMDNGRTVKKSNETWMHVADAFTNRPLKNDEVFEVRLKRIIIGDHKHTIGIGVTSSSPDLLDMSRSIFEHKNNTWLMQNDILYEHGQATHWGFGINLNTLKEGATVGVMRNSSGYLHFFVDGTDFGSTLGNIPKEVYGVFELCGNAVEATIVDH